MNSQPIQAIDLKKAQGYLASVDKALVELRDAESKLQEMRYKLELMVNVFQSQDQKKMKLMKDSINPLATYEKFEDIILKNVLPVIKPSKTRIDPILYQKYMKTQHLNTSLKVYRDEVASIFQDLSIYKDFKAFSNVFAKSEKAMLDISYDLLLNTLRTLAQVEKGLLIRFDKSLEFIYLPETFYICFVRLDLITVTLTFRKVPDQKLDSMKNEENLTTEKVDRNKVNLVNTVYSNIFDGGITSQSQKKSEPFYFFPEEFKVEDPEIKELVEMIQQNQHRIILPCIYPNMVVFQRFSHHMGEKIETINKVLFKEKDNHSNQSKILAMILRQNPEEFVATIENRCVLCRKKFIMDSQYQKMLPPLYMSKGETKGEKPKSFHLECRKIYKGDSIAPQVIVEVDCSDESSLFDNSL